MKVMKSMFYQTLLIILVFNFVSLSHATSTKSKKTKRTVAQQSIDFHQLVQDYSKASMKESEDINFKIREAILDLRLDKSSSSYQKQINDLIDVAILGAKKDSYYIIPQYVYNIYIENKDGFKTVLDEMKHSKAKSFVKIMTEIERAFKEGNG